MKKVGTRLMLPPLLENLGKPPPHFGQNKSNTSGPLLEDLGKHQPRFGPCPEPRVSFPSPSLGSWKLEPEKRLLSSSATLEKKGSVQIWEQKPPQPECRFHKFAPETTNERTLFGAWTDFFRGAATKTTEKQTRATEQLRKHPNVNPGSK